MNEAAGGYAGVWLNGQTSTMKERHEKIDPDLWLNCQRLSCFSYAAGIRSLAAPSSGLASQLELVRPVVNDEQLEER